MTRDLERRQIWAPPTSLEPRCTGYQLPSSGVLILNATQTISLTQDAIYSPDCTPSSSASALSNATLPVWGMSDPFEASTVPQIFVLGATLVISWLLVIILLITPRTSFVLGTTGSDHLGRRTLGSGGSSSTVIAVGGRPWLQKFAATTVGISLFIACVNSFKIIESQYQSGYEDAFAVTVGVVGSLELRVIRVVSTTSLWLAQVQTLIRLFPRHREKVIIKWSGFGLIFLDTIFAILNNFVSGGGAGPGTVGVRKYTEAIPALSYLFELALSLLYAAWVIYYSLVKRRFAFFHPKMRNICVVALLSYISVLIPVTFFVLDISKPELASWGDYVRWVGAAAASVVVWEWVERIEALEREERRDGILGREIFDGDEMLGKSQSGEIRWPRSRSLYKGQVQTSRSVPNSNGFRRTKLDQYEAKVSSPTKPLGESLISSTQDSSSLGQQRLHAREPLFPPTTASPVSRSDTTSASTIYTVVHHPVSNSTSPAQDTQLEPITPGIRFAPEAQLGGARTNAATSIHAATLPGRGSTIVQAVSARLNVASNPFKRRRHSPPAEISRLAVDATGQPSVARWSKSRSPRKFVRVRRHQQALASELPIVVVPAQPRGRIWSPPISQEASSAGDANSDGPLASIPGKLIHDHHSIHSSPSQPRGPSEMNTLVQNHHTPQLESCRTSGHRLHTTSPNEHRSLGSGIGQSTVLSSVEERAEDAIAGHEDNIENAVSNIGLCRNTPSPPAG